MDFNSTVDLIIRDLQEAGEIIDDLKNYQGVPLLQVELAKSKCRSAAEVIALLKNMKNFTDHSPAKETVKEKPAIPKVKPVPEVKKEVVLEPVADNPVIVSDEVIIADTFAGNTDALYEQLAVQGDDKDLLASISKKPISDLSEAIGVNDKFLFIREIFNGSPDQYSQAITKLNESGTFAEANALLMSFTSGDPESVAAQQLLELVKRKFPGNE